MGPFEPTVAALRRVGQGTTCGWVMPKPYIECAWALLFEGFLRWLGIGDSADLLRQRDAVAKCHGCLPGAKTGDQNSCQRNRSALRQNKTENQYGSRAEVAAEQRASPGSPLH